MLLLVVLFVCNVITVWLHLMCFKTCVTKILKSVCLKAKDFEGNAPSAPSLLYTWLLSMEPQHGTSNCSLIFFTAISFAFHRLFSSFDGNCWCPPWDPQVCIDHLWGVISVSVQCENIFWVFSTAIEENSAEMFWQLGESIALKIISSLLDLCLICPVSQRCVGESQLAESSLGSTTELQFLSNTGNIQLFIPRTQPTVCLLCVSH